MPTHLKTGIIVIHQLPKTPETLWLRILGKGGVQAQAIQEVAALPTQHPQRRALVGFPDGLARQDSEIMYWSCWVI